MEKVVIVLVVFHDYFLNSNLQWFNEFTNRDFPLIKCLFCKVEDEDTIILGPFLVALVSQEIVFVSSCKVQIFLEWSCRYLFIVQMNHY